jgi:hypothetical protein
MSIDNIYQQTSLMYLHNTYTIKNEIAHWFVVCGLWFLGLQSFNTDNTQDLGAPSGPCCVILVHRCKEFIDTRCV